MEPDASVSLWRAGLQLLVRCRVAGLLEEVHRLDGVSVELHRGCRKQSRTQSELHPKSHLHVSKLGRNTLPVFLLLRVQ